MSTVGMRALGLTHGPDVTPEAVEAAARWLHDEYCEGGDTAACGRWRSGGNPGNHHARHREYYRDQARAVLKAAAPHMGERG